MVECDVAALEFVVVIEVVDDEDEKSLEDSASLISPGVRLVMGACPVGVMGVEIEDDEEEECRRANRSAMFFSLLI